MAPAIPRLPGKIDGLHSFLQLIESIYSVTPEDLPVKLPPLLLLFEKSYCMEAKLGLGAFIHKIYV